MYTSFDIKEPGLNVLPLGVERHIVNGGGLTGIQILPDDEIEIINNFLDDCLPSPTPQVILLPWSLFLIFYRAICLVCSHQDHTYIILGY